ncbi:MAG: glycosyltransferase family 2 protein [Acidobacteria bacterium]|nr:glycosyltransferase family 2 protein [Acidobacteriota bacterium]
MQRIETNNPLVYVVILNYNGKNWLEPCLRSLLSTNYRNFKVILVDNASIDGSVGLVKNLFPEVEIIINPSNYGFSEGNNIGIRKALSENAGYLVLLNPDTWVEPSWLAHMVDVGESEPTVGILGPVQLNYMDSDFNSWTRTALLQHLNELRNPEQAGDWIAVEWVEGSCFVVKRDVFEAIGLLDPIYFAFYEEIDFCRRAVCRGYQTALVPRSRIHHYRGGSWQANQRLAHEREYRCDRSQFIYSMTDPRKTLFANFYCYLLTLAVKAKALLQDFSVIGAWKLIRMQIDVFGNSGKLLSKWRRERSLLRKVVSG